MTLKTASVLAFERKLNPSDGLLSAGLWSDREKQDRWSEIALREKAIRGTISNRLKNAIATNPAKLDAEVEKPNLQVVDSAALPLACDTLRLDFTLRVIGGFTIPSACNNADYQKALEAAFDEYVKKHGLSEIAFRYACNLANGRFLWRNRIGAEAIEVRVSVPSGAQHVFDAYARPLDDLVSADESIKKIADVINSSLLGDEYGLLSISAFVKLGFGQEVFPSQELVQDKQNNKSKHLYEVDGVAAIHAQKLGNAIRTIDTWHPSVDEIGAIAVEPYGSVTSRGSAYRQPSVKVGGKRIDFYSLLDNWILKGETPNVEQQHFVAATLVRGGVFGAKAD